jgi:hypothetical protein
MEKGEIQRMLKDALNKCCCTHTEHKGDVMMDQLRLCLLLDDYEKLSIARNHFLIGEGRGEFDEICNQLIVKYA